VHRYLVSFRESYQVNVTTGVFRRVTRARWFYQRNDALLQPLPPHMESAVEDACRQGWDRLRTVVPVDSNRVITAGALGGLVQVRKDSRKCRFVTNCWAEVPFVVNVTSAHPDFRDHHAFADALDILRFQSQLGASSREAEREWETAWEKIDQNHQRLIKEEAERVMKEEAEARERSERQELEEREHRERAEEDARARALQVAAEAKESEEREERRRREEVARRAEEERLRALEARLLEEKRRAAAQRAAEKEKEKEAREAAKLGRDAERRLQLQRDREARRRARGGAQGAGGGRDRTAQGAHTRAPTAARQLAQSQARLLLCPRLHPPAPGPRPRHSFLPPQRHSFLQPQPATSEAGPDTVRARVCRPGYVPH